MCISVWPTKNQSEYEICCEIICASGPYSYLYKADFLVHLRVVSCESS